MQSNRPSIDQSSIIARTPFFYGWVILAVSAVALFISGPGQTYSVSLFVGPIISELGWSRTMVSGMYTLGSLTAGAAMILVGRLQDRYGARVMLTSVGILFGFAALGMSAMDHPLELYVGFAALRTLGQGSLTLIPTTLIALWFVRLRGRAIAIGSIGSAVSLAVFPPVIHALITHVGWRAAWVALAFIIWGVLLLPAALLVRSRPESVGLLPDGLVMRPRDQAENTQATVAGEVNLSLSEAMRTRAFWLLLFAGSSQSLISTGLIFHQVSLLASKGVPSGVAASVLSVMAPMSLFGIFVAGFMADRFPNRYLLAGGQALLAVAMLFTFIIASTWQALLYGALLGLTGGFLMSTTSVIWPNYFGRYHLGSIRGVATSSMVTSAALGPLPFGYLFDQTGSYSIAILIFLALPAACALAALMAKPPRP